MTITHTAKYLSILVSDTIKEEASYLELKLTHYSSDETESKGIPGEEISFEELHNQCKAYHVKGIFDKNFGPPPEYSGGYVEKSILLSFESRDDLIACLNKMSGFSKVIPNIVCLKIPEHEPLQNRLFLKAIEKGKKKASQYASQLNKKIGELLSVEEMRSPEWNIRDEDAEHIDVRNAMDKESGGWTIYLPSASNLADYSRLLDTSVSFMATFKLTFELE